MPDGNEGATKADIEALRAYISEELKLHREDLQSQREELKLHREELHSQREELHSQREELSLLRSEMAHQYHDLVERMEDRETRLLKAFYGFVDSNQKRIGEVEGNESALRGRVNTIESRLIEIEKRLNIPPAA